MWVTSGARSLLRVRVSTRVTCAGELAAFVKQHMGLGTNGRVDMINNGKYGHAAYHQPLSELLGSGRKYDPYEMIWSRDDLSHASAAEPAANTVKLPARANAEACVKLQAGAGGDSCGKCVTAAATAPDKVQQVAAAAAGRDCSRMRSSCAAMRVKECGAIGHGAKRMRRPKRRRTRHRTTASEPPGTHPMAGRRAKRQRQACAASAHQTQAWNRTPGRLATCAVATNCGASAVGLVKGAPACPP